MLLIKLISNYPAIYDPNHPDFQNCDLRRRTWKRVAKRAKYEDGKFCLFVCLLSFCVIIGLYKELSEMHMYPEM